MRLGNFVHWTVNAKESSKGYLLVSHKLNNVESQGSVLEMKENTMVQVLDWGPWKPNIGREYRLSVVVQWDVFCDLF